MQSKRDKKIQMMIRDNKKGFDFNKTKNEDARIQIMKGKGLKEYKSKNIWDSHGKLNFKRNSKDNIVIPKFEWDYEGNPATIDEGESNFHNAHKTGKWGKHDIQNRSIQALMEEQRTEDTKPSIMGSRNRESIITEVYPHFLTKTTAEKMNQELSKETGIPLSELKKLKSGSLVPMDNNGSYKAVYLEKGLLGGSPSDLGKN